MMPFISCKHRFDVFKPQFLFAWSLILPKDAQLMGGDRIALDGICFDEIVVHGTDKAACDCGRKLKGVGGFHSTGYWQILPLQCSLHHAWLSASGYPR